MKKRTKLLSLLLVVLMLVSVVTPFAVFATDGEAETPAVSGTGTVSHLTTNKKIIDSGKLVENGFIAAANFDNWTFASTKVNSANAKYVYGAVIGSSTLIGHANKPTWSIDNGALKVVPDTGNDDMFYIRVGGNDTAGSAYADRRFVFQMDYKLGAIGKCEAIIQVDSKISGVGQINFVGCNANGELLTGGALMKDNEGNTIKLSTEEFITLALIADPIADRYWIAVNGEIYNTAGYVFTEAQTYENFFFRDIRVRANFGGSVAANNVHYGFTVDNVQLYFVDDTYTYEDYLKLMEFDGSAAASAFTTTEAILATGKLVENGFILSNTFETWTSTGSKSPSATDLDLYGNTKVGTWTQPINATGNSGSSALVKDGGNTALQVVSKTTEPYYLVRINNASKKAVANDASVSGFIGQSFVYQMDYKADSYDDAEVNLISFYTKATTSSSATHTMVKVLKDGYLKVRDNGSFVSLVSDFGEHIRLSTTEYATIALFVNPQVNRYWIMIDGELVNEAGYVFMHKTDMQKFVVTASGTGGATTDADTYIYDEATGKYLDKDGNVTDNPVPYIYLLYDIRCSLGITTAYVDNTQFYFVDQTYTYNDYLDMVNPVMGNTATLGSTIGYNYYLNLPEKFLAANPDLTAKITVDGKTEEINVADCPVTDYDVDGDGKVDKWVKVTCNLAAAEMTKEIKFVLAQGATVYSNRTDTVKSYAETVANGTDEVAANVAKSMLVYGAYAQKFFNVDADNLAADVTAAELMDIPTEKTYGIVGNRFNYVTSALALQSETVICHYFDNVEGLTFKLNGEDLTAVADGDFWRVEIAVDAANIDTVYALVVSDGTNEYTINYGAISYLQMASSLGNADLDNLVKALYTYNVYADEYVISK